MLLVWVQSMGLVSTTHHPTQCFIDICMTRTIRGYLGVYWQIWGGVRWEEGVRINGNITINKCERDVGGSMAAVRRWQRRQRQRRWQQRKARWRHTAQRRQRGGSSVEAAAVAAAQHREVSGSAAAARQQWQRQRRWRQRDSATSAVAAARQRNISRSVLQEQGWHNQGQAVQVFEAEGGEENLPFTWN